MAQISYREKTTCSFCDLTEQAQVAMTKAYATLADLGTGEKLDDLREYHRDRVCTVFGNTTPADRDTAHRETPALCHGELFAGADWQGRRCYQTRKGGQRQSVVWLQSGSFVVEMKMRVVQRT